MTERKWSQYSLEDIQEAVTKAIEDGVKNVSTQKNLLTCKETEDFLSISHQTRIDYTNKGILKAYKFPGCRYTYYKKSEILAALQHVPHLF